MSNRFDSIHLPTLSLLLLLAIACLATPPGLATAAGTPSCHGKRATITGTDGEDVLKERDVDSGDVIALGDGDDYVYLGGVSHVLVCGGQGDDDITAGQNAGRHLTFDGEEGRDDLGSAWSGGNPRVSLHSLRLIGGPAIDSLSGSQEEDVLRSGNGNDLSLGNDGDDRIWGGAGKDSLGGGGGADLILGGRGDDNLYGGEWLYPGPPADRGDFTDGEQGRDYCVSRRQRSCERRDEYPR